LKEKYGALLILDETLSFGVFGDRGRGLLEVQGIEPRRIDAIIGSLEHSVAAVGGFCAGRKGLIDHQRLSGSGYCFSAAAPPASCAAADATIADLEVGGAERRRSLRVSAERLHAEARKLASSGGVPLELLSSPESFVQHLRWTGADAAEGERKLLAAAELLKRGTEGVRIQVCSPGACSADASFGARTGAPPAPAPSLRLCASAEHSTEDISSAMDALRRALAV